MPQSSSERSFRVSFTPLSGYTVFMCVKDRYKCTVRNEASSLHKTFGVNNFSVA